MDKFYEYSKILDQSTIRLILLQPSRDLEAEVRCSLINVPLQELDKDIIEHYVALSYVWGDPIFSCSVLVDEKKLRITSSLDCALRHLREPARVLRLWADGICINQNDIEDRNQQVRLMGSVYSLAQHTVIFLGASNSEAESIIQYIAAQNESRFQAHSVKDKPLPDDLRAKLESSILSHQWFTRVWVLQELVLSAEPWVQYGEARVRWDQFCKFVLPTSNHASPNTEILGATSMNEIRKAHRRIKLNDVQNLDPASENMLLQILPARRGAGVSDPRDMLYGHLGLLHSHIEPPMDIDYGKSVAQIYEDSARYFINTEKSLNLLQHIEGTELNNRRVGLPSWVPDWTLRVEEIYTEFNKSDYAGFKDYDFPPSVPHTLVLNGLEYGRIKYLIKPPFTTRFNPPEDRLADVSQPLNEILRFGHFDLGGKVARISGYDPFKERISGFKLKHAPETIVDACTQICAEFYDEIDAQGLTPDPPLSYFINIAEEFRISTDHLPPKYNILLSRFAHVLVRMEHNASLSGPPDALFAVLDTGGSLPVSNKARVGDSICSLSPTNNTFFIFRHTSVMESGDMEQRLERDPVVKKLVKGPAELRIKIGKYVSHANFRHRDYLNLCPFGPIMPILMALH